MEATIIVVFNSVFSGMTYNHYLTLNVFPFDLNASAKKTMQQRILNNSQRLKSEQRFFFLEKKQF